MQVVSTASASIALATGSLSMKKSMIDDAFAVSQVGTPFGGCRRDALSLLGRPLCSTCAGHKFQSAPAAKNSTPSSSSPILASIATLAADSPSPSCKYEPTTCSDGHPSMSTTA